MSATMIAILSVIAFVFLAGFHITIRTGKDDKS